MKTLKNKRILVLLAIALLGLSAFPSIRISANVEAYQNRSASRLEETYTSVSSEALDHSTYKPYKRTTFVYSDPTSYLDEYAFIASVPANVFWHNKTLYTAPIIYGESITGDYLLEDWKTYCDHWGGISYMDFIGPYSTDYIETMKDYLESEKYGSIVADNPYEYAAEIALHDWTNSDAAVIAPAKTHFAKPQKIYGEFHGNFFDITSEYIKSYYFGPELSPPTFETFPIESSHPYVNNEFEVYPIYHPGAEAVRVHFENITVEQDFDHIFVLGGNFELIADYTGHHLDVWTPLIIGDTVYIVLYSDEIFTEWGFLADGYEWFTSTFLPVIRVGEWLNFTVPANMTGINHVEVSLLNYVEYAGDIILRCYLIDPDGNLVDYDFYWASPEEMPYTWTMEDTNERPSTTLENYTVAVYAQHFDDPDYGFMVDCFIESYAGKPDNAYTFMIPVPKNAELLSIWWLWNSTWGTYSNNMMVQAVDPSGDWHFFNLFDRENVEYPSWEHPVYVPHPAPGNWTIITQAIPTDLNLDMACDFEIHYEIKLYPATQPDYMSSAANGAVIASLLDVPLLYTADDSLPEKAAEALRVLNVKNVILVEAGNMITAAVETTLTDIGITILEDLENMTSIISYIQGISGEADLILTIPTGSFFAPATLAGAFHGGPVLLFEGLGKEVVTLADSNWGYHWYAHELGTWVYLQTGLYPSMFYLKSPNYAKMCAMSDTFFEWIGSLGADKPTVETVVTVAPTDDVRPLFERGIICGAKAGRIPGQNAEEDVAMIDRAMLYPAIAFATQGYSKVTPSCVAYSFGIPFVGNNGTEVPVNDWNITDYAESAGYMVEPHIGEYEVFTAINEGTTFWYLANHGSLGWWTFPFLWQFPSDQGAIGLWAFDPPTPCRGYEAVNTTTWEWVEDSGHPDLYNIFDDPFPDGLVFQSSFEVNSLFRWVYGTELEDWLGSVHSMMAMFMTCYVGASEIPTILMQHGAASAFGNMRTGWALPPTTSLFTLEYARKVFAGETIGDAFIAAVEWAGYDYYTHWVNWTVASTIPYQTIDGIQPFTYWNYFFFPANTYILYGDPELTLLEPTAEEPEALDPLQMAICGSHKPGHVTRSISINITSPTSGAYIKGVIDISWTISLQNTVLESCLLYVDGSSFDVSHLTSYSWNTTEVLDGNHTITLIATDPIDNVNSTTMWVIVDNTIPTAEIGKPVGGAYLRETCNVTIFGYDPNLNLMKLYIDGTFIKNWTFNDPQTYSWDTTSLDDGSHRIRLIVDDKAGNNITIEITVTVDNTKPTVDIINAAELNETELTGLVTINFTATDTNLQLAQLIIDDTIVFNMTGETYLWDTAKVGDGSHAMKLVAYDKAGNTDADTVEVTTVNVKREIEATRNLYLGVGTPIGFIIGAIIVYAIMRRRR